MGGLEVKDRVLRMLGDIVGTVEVKGDGDFSFAWETTRLHVGVSPFRESETTVRVQAVAVWEVPESPELFKWIATQAHGYTFGALSLYTRTDGTYNVNFIHTLLGDTLDPDELRHAVNAVSWTANEIDEIVVEKFGGKRWADY